MKKHIVFAISIAFFLGSCKKDTVITITAKDINTATKVSIDRFSSTAGHLMVRTATNGLPAANSAINFDNAPFITQGIDRTGAIVQYYNFDVQSTTPDDIYVFFKAGATTPISGQNRRYRPPKRPATASWSVFFVARNARLQQSSSQNVLAAP